MLVPVATRYLSVSAGRDDCRVGPIPAATCERRVESEPPGERPSFVKKVLSASPSTSPVPLMHMHRTLWAFYNVI
jgi:hypothetical protein